MLHQRLNLHFIGSVALLVVVGALGMLMAARPSLAQGNDDSWAPVTIVYTSDVKGHIDPCG